MIELFYYFMLLRGNSSSRSLRALLIFYCLVVRGTRTIAAIILLQYSNGIIMIRWSMFSWQSHRKKEDCFVPRNDEHRMASNSLNEIASCLAMADTTGIQETPIRDVIARKR